MCSLHRPRPALGIEAALAEMMNNRYALYDAAGVGACVKRFREGRFARPR